MRLRTLHATLFAGLAVTLTLCGAFLALQLVTSRMKGEIENEMTFVAGEVRNILDRSMYGRWRDVVILAAAARSSAPTTEARRAWLDAMQRTFPAYAWIGFADRNGVVTASTGRILEGTSVEGRPWFKGALTSPFVGDLHKAVLLEKHLPAAPDGAPWRFLDVAAPVLDQNGVVEGVVGGHLSWAWARDLTRSVIDPQAANAPGTEILIVDREGTVILGPADLEGSPLPKISDVWRGVPQKGRHAVETWPDGVTYLIGASLSVGMHDYPGLGWTILVRRPTSLAFAPAHDLAAQLLVGGLSLAILASLIGVLIGWHISRPLVRLTEAADALARTPSSAPKVSVGGTIELRRLADALNRMWEAVAERDRNLAEVNQSLERRVEERTRQLDEMRHAAERASQAKTDFLAAMSHEIRTPLNAIIGFTDEMTRSGRLDPVTQRQAEVVRTAGDALLTIVNDILDFSKVEAGAVELLQEPFAPRDLIEGCAAIVRGLAASKQLELTIAVDPALPAALRGDEARLRQVLLNLLNNAVKFTPAGRILLAVHREGSSEDGERLRFHVTDTGIGISRSKQEHLFQRFSQVDSSTQRSYGGTGLGLAISKQLVVLMGGEIGVHSEEGEGSTFWFAVTLPAARMPTTLTVVSHAAGPRRRGRLLLAEDVAINQELARAVLEAAGHTVDIVGNGAEAVEAVRTNSYDLVLMDVQMPGMDGLTATQLIRRMQGPAGRLPVIAMTANVLPGELDRFRAAGMDDHIGKPFNRAELYATVNRWLTAAADSSATGCAAPGSRSGTGGS